MLSSSESSSSTFESESGRSNSSSSVSESESCLDSSVSPNSEIVEGNALDYDYDSFGYKDDVKPIINFLHPLHNKKNLTTLAKVVSKSDVKFFFNHPWVTKLAVVNFADHTGVIRATLFNEKCDNFYHLLEDNKTYHLRNCIIGHSDKRYTTIDHQFTLNFGHDSVIEPCPENDDIVIPNIIFNFMPLQDIQHIKTHTFIDVIGIVSSVWPVEYPGNKMLRKIELIDSSDESITVCLWGTFAQKFEDDIFNVHANPILALKAAKVSEHNGIKNIAVSNMQTIIKLYPRHEKTEELKKWLQSRRLHECEILITDLDTTMTEEEITP